MPIYTVTYHMIDGSKEHVDISAPSESEALDPATRSSFHKSGFWAIDTFAASSIPVKRLINPQHVIKITAKPKVEEKVTEVNS